MLVVVGISVRIEGAQALRGQVLQWTETVFVAAFRTT